MQALVRLTLQSSIVEDQLHVVPIITGEGWFQSSLMVLELLPPSGVMSTRWHNTTEQNAGASQ